LHGIFKLSVFFVLFVALLSTSCARLEEIA